MAFTRPRSLRVCCRQTLPLMLRETGGRGMVEAVAEIVETDRWNSFDRFHDTTKTLVRRYEEAGAEVEVCSVQTGGRMGSGRWIIREAADVRGATVDVVAPLKQRVLDYRENPWHAVEIAELAAWEECDGRYSSGAKGYREVELERVIAFFEAHEELGYVTFDE